MLLISVVLSCIVDIYYQPCLAVVLCFRTVLFIISVMFVLATFDLVQEMYILHHGLSQLRDYDRQKLLFRPNQN